MIFGYRIEGLSQVHKICGILLLILQLLFSLQLSAISSPTSFRNIKIADELSSNLIHSIYKDQKGFIWLGTLSGLNRFDGINVKSYQEYESESVSCIYLIPTN